MTTRTATVGASVGLHARPASLFVQAVKATGLPVTISKGDGKPGDARSILAVMGLGAKKGDVVVLTLPDEYAETDSLDTLVALLESDLDAE